VSGVSGVSPRQPKSSHYSATPFFAVPLSTNTCRLKGKGEGGAPEGDKGQGKGERKNL